MTRCDVCQQRLEIGDFPFCPHGKPTPSKGFEPHYDYGLDQYVTTPGDRNKAMRPYWENDHIVQLQPRDKPAVYWKELAERRAERREETRRNGH